MEPPPGTGMIDNAATFAFCMNGIMEEWDPFLVCSGSFSILFSSFFLVCGSERGEGYYYKYIISSEGGGGLGSVFREKKNNIWYPNIVYTFFVSHISTWIQEILVKIRFDFALSD